ncbi:ribonuclease R [Kordiimonas sp. SCSIO 12603]|uniref:ribonuclease R n=1 Tax=Kordiimonas sp. SCSIO 12603 TaxID=2829596 RepID=UPI002103077E|nr:ribonuclease R [Kordiimonas sp. SCSIO 12603]UTW57031.1 ribonuclease R [Kordiimonas sp. SCSIO 12603]
MAKDRTGEFPTKAQLIDFIKGYEGKVTKREVARAFGIRGQEKIMLKQVLRELVEEGHIAKDTQRALRPANRLPGVQVIEFAGLDKHGDPLGKLENYQGDGPPPTIYIQEGRRKKTPAMGKGDRALVHLIPVKDDPPIYRAKVIKTLRAAPSGILGVFKGNENGGRIHPVNKKDRDEYWVDREDTRGAADGELVTAEFIRSGNRRKLGPRRARIKERLGDVAAAKSISMIAIHAHDIPYEFPQHVTKAADRAKPVDLGNRTDLRNVPLITIDPADARDHDDAIWAEEDPDPANPGGWHAIVAIADVAHYVQPDSPLDKEALRRGNSCYFPDRVVPMLPEVLSAGLCSLQPSKERACMAVHMWFDKNGKKLRHQFVRGLMKSHANINYQQAQRALDGMPDEMTEPLLEPVLKPLYGTFKALMSAREKRDPLELDMPERRIQLDDLGQVKGIALRERLDTHRLVEEFMVTANVCAAETLEDKNVPAMYRVHEEPSMDKLDSLREFLASLKMKLAKGAVMMPRLFNGILNQVKDGPYEQMVNQVVLRSQTQAYYSTENLGHFGLALRRYAHFTSPIRRYSDLIVHRGLVKALKLGDDGLTEREMLDMGSIGEQISGTERRAMAAERDSTDRYMASYLSDHIGDEFIGRVTGVTRFGLFVELEPSGGDGLIPISEIGNDYYVLDEDQHKLVGERYGQEFKLGDKLDVRLTEANQFTGGLKLELVTEGDAGSVSGKPRRNSKERIKNQKRRHSRSRNASKKKK